MKMATRLRNMFFPLLFALAQISWAIAISHGLREEQPPSAIFKYHGGALLTGPRSIKTYLIWYGGFSRENRASITGFFASFNPSKAQEPQPTVAAWWSRIQSYKDKSGNSVPSTVRLVKQVGDMYSLGKSLKRSQIASIINNKIANKILPLDSNAIYLVLTSKDVTVERFCMGSCGFHDSMLVAKKTRLVYGHVGDPSAQCPGLCAWPYAVPAYGPQFPGQPLVPPNGVDVDGMLINIATILLGAVTNPYKTGYFQGNALAPLEAATACSGIFGAGAYPGYPGQLLVDKTSKASFNVYGTNATKFLLPAIWDPKTSNCKVIT
ncbi:hypothetical protein L6164_034728 [Bauhinia variegata]|uniref:Uncharacterized protein n=1 Tax=Bauhinia variegata TaxID=167791 RepID=A0ACB9KVI7_BAUVA|nr:hypothetical protein L6164_034728 [Bauhinia variegata]